MTRLEEVAFELFGKMREATEDEQESIDSYIETISKPTGVSMFDCIDEIKES